MQHDGGHEPHPGHQNVVDVVFVGCHDHLHDGHVVFFNLYLEEMKVFMIEV